MKPADNMIARRPFFFTFLFLALLLLPQFGFAATAVCALPVDPSFVDVVGMAICFINKLLVPLAFAVAIVIFVYGVVKYMANGADEEARKKGRDFIVWSIIALFVMVSIWGFVNLLSATFKLNNDGPIAVPEAPVYDPE